VRLLDAQLLKLALGAREAHMVCSLRCICDMSA
jgi:hypothetical protein